jgi:hypothetical protein
MRTLGLSFLALSIAFSPAFACGLTVAVPGDDGGTLPGDAGGGDAAVDGAGGDAAADGNRVEDAAPIDASGKTCGEISKGIDSLRPQVGTCCAACRALQCTQTVDDLCCAISATTVDPEFVALVAEYKKRCPPTVCTDVLCKVTPSNVCDPDPVSPNSGTCR